jgi:carboxyl-terminal processing protease
MKKRTAAGALMGIVISVALLATTPIGAQAAGANSSLVVDALHVLERYYVEEVDPLRLLNAAIASLRRATGLGEDALPYISAGTPDPRAIASFRREFDYAVRAGSVSQADLAYTVTREMLASLHDSHVYYLDPTQLKRRQEAVAGNAKYEGIGVFIRVLEGESAERAFFVTDVVPGSPAAAAGLKPFDRIIAIDGISVPPTASINDLATQVRGPRGSPLELTVQRSGETLHLSAVRGPFQVPTVEAHLIRPGVVYIKLYTFSKGVGAQLRHLLRPLMAQGPIESVVLDLRDNWGGYLREAESVAGVFVPAETLLVRMLQRDGPAKLVATGETLLPKATLVVLTDKGTASSSEVVVMGLKHQHRATIVGEKTAGALGGAREVPLSAGGMYVAVSEIVGPRYEQIDLVGILPDHQIELSFSDLARGVDTQLAAALKAIVGVMRPELVAV